MDEGEDRSLPIDLVWNCRTQRTSCWLLIERSTDSVKKLNGHAEA